MTRRPRQPAARALHRAAVLVLTALSTLALAPAADAAQSQPNVIVVMTDDQSLSQFQRRVMPATHGALVRRGSRFTNSFVSSPLCCPSRAGFLTGAYAHNNGVFDNEPGYPALADPRSTIFSWLQAAGYRTGHVGRFLLGYGDGAGTLDGLLAPPGVDDWFGYADEQTHYYNARFSDNGIASRVGYDPRHGYTTEVINREAREFVAESAPSPDPFFLWVAHVAPHTVNATRLDACGEGTPIAEPGTFERFRKQRLPHGPAFNEKRISDKPHWVRNRGRVPPERRALLRRGWRCALAALTSVDRGVAELVAELELRGELDDTAIFFTSDNGLLFGEHRLVQAKAYPYEETIRVPLVARVPAAYRTGPARGLQARRINEPVTNLDLTATVLDLVGARPCAAGACRAIDGRSLVPLLSGKDRGWPKRRGTLVELGQPSCARDPAVEDGLSTFYDAIRTPRFLYVELHHVDRATGLCDRFERELYDLVRDPFQLENLAVNAARRKPSKLQRGLAARLATLRRCAGASGSAFQVAGRPRCE